jgi:flagellar biosynthetic protein FliR
MERYILRTIVDSFEVIPINGADFNWDGLLTTMVTYMADSFVIAFRIILPVFACIMILNCVLGIMAKVSPQMNMFAVGMQLKVLVGLVVLFLTATMLPGIADFVFTEMKRMMVSVIEYMAP